MSIALKVFCVGVTFGGASGLAPFIPAAKSGSNSSLDNNAAKRIKREIDAGTRICWGYSKHNEKTYGRELGKNGVRFFFGNDRDNVCKTVQMNGRDDRIAGQTTNADWKKVDGFGVVELEKPAFEKINKMAKMDKDDCQGENKCDGLEFLYGSLNDDEPPYNTIIRNYARSLRVLIKTLVKEQIGDGTGVVNK